MNLTTLQEAVGEWQTRVFPDSRSSLPPGVHAIVKAAKVAEEAGEVAGAAIKRYEGRATTRDLEDEIGDVMITLAGLAEVEDLNLALIVERRWAEVAQRTYQANPATHEPSTVDRFIEALQPDLVVDIGDDGSWTCPTCGAPGAGGVIQLRHHLAYHRASEAI